MPKRRGNGHPNIAPYQVFECMDGHVIVAVGNDSQYQRFAGWLGHADLINAPRFTTNSDRLRNREELVGKIQLILKQRTTDDIIGGLEQIKVPVGPVNTLDRVFGSDQVAAREMKISITTDATGKGSVELIGNPLKFSKTPVSYRLAPPHVGQHNGEILQGYVETK